MKKTIFALFALAGIAAGVSLDASLYTDAQKTSLKGAYNFSSTDAINTSFFGSNLSGVENGILTIGSGSAQAYTKDCGIGASPFTVSFDLLGLTPNSSADGVIISLYSNGNAEGANTALTLGVNTAGYIYLQNGDGGTTANSESPYGNGRSPKFRETLTLNASDISGQTMTIVADNNTNTLSLYVNGTSVYTNNEWKAGTNGTLALNGIQIGKYLVVDTNNISEVKMDNLSVWSRALSADEVQGLITPEPGTTTLSLLALAGLAARRRRK
ncbi:MAG: PEP-CTERM sorting domain-containing protein [Akkermansia sp.]|nr:PEP-CTERM sorting domain-containing protein [Akkermansia sp.]